MQDIDEWKDKLSEELRKEPEIEKVPAMVKKCPKCGNLSLEFDIEQGKIKCTKCGFEESIPR